MMSWVNRMWFDGERCDIFFRTMVRHAMTKKSIKIVHYKQQSRENNNVNKEKQELHCPNAAEPQSILLSSISAEHWCYKIAMWTSKMLWYYQKDSQIIPNSLQECHLLLYDVIVSSRLWLDDHTHVIFLCHVLFIFQIHSFCIVLLLI